MATASGPVTQVKVRLNNRFRCCALIILRQLVIYNILKEFEYYESAYAC